MVPIFLPNLPTLSKLITQVSQEELQILISLRKRVLKRCEYIIQSWFLRRFADFLGQFEVFVIMFQIGFGVECSACFEMPGDDFLGFEGLNYVKS